MPKPKKQGQLAQQEGKLFLTTDDEKAYQVDEFIAFVWDRCDGETESADIVAAVSEQLEAPEEDRGKVGEAIDSVLDQLGEAGLINKE